MQDAFDDNAFIVGGEKYQVTAMNCLPEPFSQIVPTLKRLWPFGDGRAETIYFFDEGRGSCRVFNGNEIPDRFQVPDGFRP